MYVIALGKAATAMARGAVSALRAKQCHVAPGIIVTAHQPTAADVPDGFVVHVGDHPVPGPASLEASDALEDALRDIPADAVVFVLLSGGTTAVTAAPLPAFSQQCGDAGRAQAHIANLAQTLLESGLAIHEMNAIRRRVLRWSAGRLAVALYARNVSHIAVFAISDVIGDAPEVIGSGPCSPETLDTTSVYALLDAYELRGSLERDMSQFLGLSGGNAPPDVPAADHPVFARTSYQFVARNSDAVAAAGQAARAAGVVHVDVHLTPLEGEASTLGDHLARMAVHLAESRRPTERVVWIAGGEPVVHLRKTIASAIDADDTDSAVDAAMGNADEPLKGGRMQVVALAAALALEELHHTRGDAASRITILAAGTDGRDGPTDAAGAIVDAATPFLAQRNGARRPDRDLLTGRSWFSLQAADTLIRVGPTGTNVMDIVVVIIEPAL